MAVFLNNGVVLTVNAVDLSDHVTAITINRTFDELDRHRDGRLRSEESKRSRGLVSNY
jgi:hypothetical protein